MRKRSEVILDHLRENSRKSLAAIAREEGVAVSTVFDHVGKLERSVIDRHVSLLDYPSLGFPFRTFFYCGADDQQALISFFKGHKGTNSIHQLSSGLIAAEMVFCSLQEEESFKEQLDDRCRDVRQHRILEPVLMEGWRTGARTVSGEQDRVSDSAR